MPKLRGPSGLTLPCVAGVRNTLAEFDRLRARSEIEGARSSELREPGELMPRVL
jgi:hypothetical protein